MMTPEEANKIADARRKRANDEYERLKAEKKGKKK